MVVVIVLVIGLLLFSTPKGRKALSNVAKRVASSSLKVLVYLLLIALGIFILVMVVKWAIHHIFAAILIIAALIGTAFAISAYWEAKEKKLHAAKVAEWLASETKTFDDLQIEQMLRPVAACISESDGNKAKFSENFPFGRITYFLNFFQRNLENEEPLFFSPRRSINRDEIREYGIVLTTAGLYVSKQTTKTDKSGNLITKDVFMPFSGAVFTNLTEDRLTVYYEKFKDQKTIGKSDTSVSLKALNDCFSLVSSSGISRAMRDSAVLDHVAVADEKEAEFLRKNASEGFAAAFETIGTAASIPRMNKVFAEVGNTMNERQGHGNAAEYANTTIDRFTGDFRAEHMGGDNQLNGPDRSTHPLFQNKTLIQTKYCNNANATISDAFDKHDYPLDIKIEVPRDQYDACVDELQKRINEGKYESKGIHKGEDARKYLKKGAITYPQAKNIAIAGTVEGITIDVMQGIVCSAGAGSITALLTFATCKWNGMDTKDAAIISLKACAKTMGRGTAIYVVTMQISRKNMVNIAHLFSKNATATVANPLFTVSENLAKKISTSSLAKTQIGKSLGLSKVSGRTLVSGTVMTAVTFGPDICRALVGRISFRQLMKNSAIGASGIAGATIGQTVIPIPIVGAMVGGAVASFIAKKTLDGFIEDDAVEMFAILKEEFMDTVPLSYLNQDEFNEVVSMTIAHEKLPSVLRDMYAYGDARKYARENIMNEAIQYVFSKRQHITESEYDNAFLEIASAEA